MAIYDPTGKVGTAIAEKEYQKTSADIQRRKEWTMTGGKSAWELAKAGSKFQRERVNVKMLGEMVPGYEDTSMFKPKKYETFTEELLGKVWKTEKDYEFTGTAKRFLKDIELGDEEAVGFLKTEAPGVKPEEAGKYYEEMMKGKPSVAPKPMTKGFGWGAREQGAITGFGKAMSGLQVGTGLYSLTSPKSSTVQQFGGAAQVALGVNTALQAFGAANLWNPTGWASLAAGFGASLAQSGALG